MLTTKEIVKLKITPDVVRNQFRSAFERIRPVMSVDDETWQRFKKVECFKDKLVKYIQTGIWEIDDNG